MRGLILTILILIVPVNSDASTAADVKKGNLLYNNKKYDEAIKAYDSAIEKKQNDGAIFFNKGNALYKKENYNGAIDLYNKALASGQARLLPVADFNIGNSQYRIGSAVVKTDIDRAREAYETALEFYKRSIDLNPADRDAKYNYEFVDQKLMALKKQQEKEKKEDKQQDKQQQKQQNQDQQQNQQQQDQKQEQQDQKQKQQQDRQQKEQQQKDQQQDQQQKEEQKQKEGEQQQQQQQGQEQEKDREQEKQRKEEEQKQEQEEQRRKEEQEQKEEERKQREEQESKERSQPQSAGEKDEQNIQFYQESGPEQKEMTEQEARMLLEGYKGEEATGQSIRMRRKQVPLPEPEKNW